MKFSRLFAALFNAFRMGVVPFGPGGARGVFMKPDDGGTGGAGGGTGGAGGAGGNGGATPPAIPDDLKPVVQAMIDQAVSGLKTKNGELIAAQKELKTQLTQFEGIDPQAVHAILKRFTDDEEAGLIKAGKIDEVLNRRTERMQADWQKKVDAEKTRALKLEAKANKLAARATSEAIIKAATKAGALPEAAEDIVLRAQGAGWTINDEGEVVAMRDNEIIFGKDGKTALTPLEWAESLREAAPHLWPRAQGSNAPGNSRANAQGADLSQMSPEARLTYARSQGAAQRH